MEKRRYATMEEFIGMFLLSSGKVETTFEELQKCHRALNIKLKNKIQFTKVCLNPSQDSTFFIIENTLDEEGFVDDKKIKYQIGIGECEIKEFLLADLDKKFVKAISDDINGYLDTLKVTI